ncbi:nitrogenase FeMo-cofactor synthesis molybdenum delivery protein NifQ [Halorhodospira halochloris]|uniref:Nitrogenase FeMo-cofactor synthesis molybdenum delivery protein NifQ n=1 Tax=Halorhodospira halochloris TaxID=1052 RepID=A0A0X8X6C7_HALHR|nr:nitrogen fixation protein NifQ [Halorhodospira halochloris]MBK1652493.1 hypothetical protein [Halorhodospira halochloris]MCG5547433.1 nitrogen fixation protein NifQ [Halorhodospira halochloris]BAU56389.1 nitrogenase FeMo-cofactor synthesis molybdenum delivery protein NifQ [Halorhodospira halochloris]
MSSQPHTVSHLPSSAERRAALLALPGQGEPFDRHLLASTLAQALQESEQPPQQSLNVLLGLGSSDLTSLLDYTFPGFADLEPQASYCDDPGEPAIEEPDLRQLLLDHRSQQHPEEAWLASIIARRALQPGHLWQSLGLDDRAQLSKMLHRHFRSLAEQNNHNMRWKKFFYRQLCASEGVLICKSPICGDCPDYSECFILDD